MIQPNSSGAKIPLKLNPVEAMPMARPAAPAGAASRTSMSREGAITPLRNPADAISAVSSSGGNVTIAITSTIAAHQRDDAKIADAGVGQAEQHEEDRQHDDGGRHDALPRRLSAVGLAIGGAGIGQPHRDHQQRHGRSNR